MSETSNSVRSIKDLIRPQPDKLGEMANLFAGAGEPLQGIAGRIVTVESKLREAVAELLGIGKEIDKVGGMLYEGQEKVAESYGVYSRASDGDSVQLTPVAGHLGSVVATAKDQQGALGVVLKHIGEQQGVANALAEQLQQDASIVSAAADAALKMSGIVTDQIEPTESWIGFA